MYQILKGKKRELWSVTQKIFIAKLYYLTLHFPVWKTFVIGKANYKLNARTNWVTESAAQCSPLARQKTHCSCWQYTTIYTLLSEERATNALIINFSVKLFPMSSKRVSNNLLLKCFRLIDFLVLLMQALYAILEVIQNFFKL